MMRRLLAAGLLLAALLVLFAQAGTAKPQPNAVKQTAKPISTLAMDGPRVAYISDGRVNVWNVITGATSVIKGKYASNSKYSQSVNDEVAIAGERVAFITRFVSGNSQQTSERLFTAPLGGSARQLGSLANHLTAPDGLSSGDWIAGVVGSGKVLAVSGWKSKAPVSTDERLRLVMSTGLRTIVTGPGAIVAQSAGSGRIAVLRSTLVWPADHVLPATSAPTVGIYSADGTLLREIAPSSAREIALSGIRLVVLTETKTLQVYDWTRGALLHTWPIRTTTANMVAGHLAVYGRLAVYAVDPRYAAPRKLHLLDLTTGKDVVIATATGGFYHSRDAAIGPRGLVYVVNYYRNYGGQHPHGKFVFVPMAKLLTLK